MGGMRASLVTDVMQAVMAVVMLVYLLGVGTGVLSFISAQSSGTAQNLFTWAPKGGYQSAESALATALLQGFFSYPFHDPVLTDRTFLSKPREMLLSFFVGGVVSGVFIILFSSIGILGDFLAAPPNGIVNKGDPAGVARKLCGVTFGLMNMIMMTTSLSTIDSTYMSITKVVSLELFGFATKCRPLSPRDAAVGQHNILIGRISIILLGIAGVAYLHMDNAEVIQAMTVSGTMVTGLGPPILAMLVWRYNSKPGANDGWRQAPLAFLFSFVPGCVFGSVYLIAGFKHLKPVPWRNTTTIYRNPELNLQLEQWSIQVGSRKGPYDSFLGINLFAFGVCWAGWVVGMLIHRASPLTKRCDAEPTFEDPSTGDRIPRPGFENVLRDEAHKKHDSDSSPKSGSLSVVSVTSTAECELSRP